MHLQEPAGQEGVGRLLGSLFDYGTTHLDRTAFHKALDDISATRTAARFPSRRAERPLRRGMQLLADNELHPALPQDAFNVQQQTLSQARWPANCSRRSTRCSALLKRPVCRRRSVAAPGHARHGRQGLKLQDAKDYFAQTYRPDLTTVVVVGDVTPEQAKSTVQKYFGGWKASGPKPT
jgi:zinc protease